MALRWPAAALMSCLVVIGLVGCTVSRAPSAPVADQAAVSSPATARAPTSTSSAPALERVMVSYVRSYTLAPLFVAADQGYLREVGIDVDMLESKGGAEVIPALGTGEIEVSGAGTSAALFSAIARGVGVRIVSPVNTYPRTGTPLPFLVRKAVYEAGEIRSARDLKGKRVAFNIPGGLAEYQWVKLLEKHGMTLDDVHISYMAIPDNMTALANGGIDAVLMPEPFARKAIETGLAVLVPEDSNPLPGVQGTFILYSMKFSQERHDVARRFMIGFVQAMRAMQGERGSSPETLEILSKWLGIEPAVIKTIVPSAEFLPDPWIDVDSLIDQQRVFIQRGALRLAEPLAPDELVDASFLNYALQVLGPYRQ